MNSTLLHLNKSQEKHICELCGKHDPTVKDYAEDFELQTGLRDYVEAVSGEKINVSDISRLCDSCYYKTRLNEDEEQEK